MNLQHTNTQFIIFKSSPDWRAFLMGDSSNMHKSLKPCNEPGCPNLTRRATVNSTSEPSRPMISTGSPLANVDITASGGRRVLAICQSTHFVYRA